MNRDLAECLDPELKGPIKMMLSQMPLMSFDDLPAARAASKRMIAAMKMAWPALRCVKTEDKSIPGPKGAPKIDVRIYQPENGRQSFPACSGSTAAATCWVK